MVRTLEQSTMRKVYLRLLPFAVLSYILAYIDRINVSFAGLTMRGDLEMSAGTFGFAVGMFYWAYFIFEVPSNVIMEKVGARVWIARIMITWGILAGADRHGHGFDQLRHRAIPAGRRRGRILSRHYSLFHLLVSEPSSRPHRLGLSDRPAGRGRDRRADIHGTSGLDGLFGLRGWQVMYIAEAIPTVVIGVITFFVLTDQPEQAKFLTAEERDWLVAKIAAERRATEAVRTYTLWQAMYNPKVLLLALNYFGIVTASLGMLIFIPQIIKSLGNYQQHDGRLAHHDPLYLRRHRHGGMGTHLRSHERAAMESVHRLACSRRSGLVIAGMTMGTWWALIGMSIAAFGLLWLQGTVLGDAADVPHRHRRPQPASPGSIRSAISAAFSDPGMSAS